jgi:hypothetical protein
MQSLFDRYPKLAQAVVAVLAARARMLVNMVEDLSLRSVAGRLARLLLDQATRGNAAIPLTHQQMAARLGTVREMISRAPRLESKACAPRGSRSCRDRGARTPHRKLEEDQSLAAQPP